MGFKVGGKCYFYLNTGTHEFPEWDLLSRLGDVMVNDNAIKDTAELRESMFNKSVVTGFELSIDASIPWDPNNEIIAALRAAYEAGGTEEGTVELFIADGEHDAVGTSYVKGPFCVTKFPSDQGVRKLVRCAIGFEPTIADYEPERGIVAGS